MIEVELPRSDRYHGPYEVPSTVLFKEFCEGVVRRYGLGGVVRKGKVLRIVPLQIAPLQMPLHTRTETSTETRTGVKTEKKTETKTETKEREKSESDGDGDGSLHGLNGSNGLNEEARFELYLDDGTTVIAEHVVVTIGGLNVPFFPPWAGESLQLVREEARAEARAESEEREKREEREELQEGDRKEGDGDRKDGDGGGEEEGEEEGEAEGEASAASTLLHSNDVIADDRAVSRVRDHVLIVGGGLTAGHLALRVRMEHSLNKWLWFTWR